MNLGMQFRQDSIQCSLLKVTNEFLNEIHVAQGHDLELQQFVGWLGIEKGETIKWEQTTFYVIKVECVCL